MDNDTIARAAIEELRSPTFGSTEEYLAIHDVKRESGRPVIERVDRERDDDLAIVYVPVERERFYLAIYVQTSDNPRVTSVETEPWHKVYFKASSSALNLTQLRAMTILEPTRTWSKGEPNLKRRIAYEFSGFAIEPNPEPDEFDDKLRKLLDLLERDVSGVRALVESADGYIQVATEFHNGNTMLGGFHIDQGLIRRMAALGLEIDLDLYCGGNLFRDPSDTAPPT
jgi:hypothetical protein